MSVSEDVQVHEISSDHEFVIHHALNHDGTYMMVVKEKVLRSDERSMVESDTFKHRLSRFLTTQKGIQQQLTQQKAKPEDSSTIGQNGAGCSKFGFELWNLLPDGKPLLDAVAEVELGQLASAGPPYICFSQDLEYAVIGDRLCRFSCEGSARSSSDWTSILRRRQKGRYLTVDIIISDRSVRSWPPTGWIASVGDEIFLAASQRPDIEEVVRLTDTADMKWDFHAYHQQHSKTTSKLKEKSTVASAENESVAPSITCISCLHSRNRSQCYFCEVCLRGGYNLCALCILKGQWCRDREHALRARQQGETIAWKHTDRLSLVSTSCQPTTERDLLLMRSSNPVDHDLLVDKQLKRVFWFSDVSSLVIYDYEIGTTSTCPMRICGSGVTVTRLYTGVLYPGMSFPGIGFKGVFSDNPILFVISIERENADVFVRCSSYWVADLKGLDVPRPLRTIRVILEAIRTGSEPAVTVGKEHWYVTYISSTGSIVYLEWDYVVNLPTQPTIRSELPSQSTETPNRIAQPPSRPFFPGESTSIPNRIPQPTSTSNRNLYAALAQSDMTDAQVLYMPTDFSCRYSTVQYFPRRGSKKGYLLLDPLSGTKQLPAKIELEDTIRRDRNLVDPKVIGIPTSFWSEPVFGGPPDQELVPSALPGSYRVPQRTGNLCQICSAVIYKSAVLDELSSWKATTSGERLDDRQVNYYSSRAYGFYKLPAKSFAAYPGATIGLGSHASAAVILSDDRYSSETLSTYTYEYLDHHRSLRDLAISAIGGCHLCAHLIRGLDRELKNEINMIARERSYLTKKPFDVDNSRDFNEPRHLESEQSIDTSSDLLDDGYEHPATKCLGSRSKSNNEGDHLKLRLKAPQSSHHTHGNLYLFRSGDQENEDPMAGIPVARLAEPDHNTENSGQSSQDADGCVEYRNSEWFNNSETTMSMAARWLSFCRTSHCCSEFEDKDQLPTRVIDVGPPDGSQELRLHIVLPRDRGMEYLTLSHCWGQVEFLKLTTFNFNELTEGFAMERLPETFQDAVTICRKLKYRYIWIDSLCIIQDGDDDEDWKQEAPLMAKVYRNSACTIAALSSESTRSGCFSFQNNLGRRSLVLPNRRGTLLRVPGHQSGCCEDTSRFHLNSRGWVFQERLLNPRILGFSSDGIYWECRQLKASERWPTGIPLPLMTATYVRMADMIKQVGTPLLQANSSRPGHMKFLEAWFEMAEDYNQLKFTYWNDKLIAIAGITEVISKATSLDYYYGIWNDVRDQGLFLSQLLWLSQDSSSAREPHDNRIPSFSWAVSKGWIDFPITFHTRHINDSTGLGHLQRSFFMKMPGEGSERTTRLVQWIIRNRDLRSIDYTRPTGETRVQDVEFRTEIKRFLDPANVHGLGFRPGVILHGPVRKVELVKVEDPKDANACLFKYPWPDVPDENDDDGVVRREEWFVPDYPTLRGLEVLCLTIARWKRPWDSRWYVAGIVLQDHCCSRAVLNGDEVRPQTRVGYFEHSWEKQTDHWNDDGELRTILLL